MFKTKFKIPFISNKNQKGKKIIKQFVSNKNDKRKAVLKLSKELEGFLGKPNMDAKVFSSLKSFDIIATSRHFGSMSWIDLWEIVPKGSKNVGYSNTINPEWTEVGGTTTINLPPNNICKTVLLELQNL